MGGKIEDNCLKIVSVEKKRKDSIKAYEERICLFECNRNYCYFNVFDLRKQPV